MPPDLVARLSDPMRIICQDVKPMASPQDGRVQAYSEPFKFLQNQANATISGALIRYFFT